MCILNKFLINTTVMLKAFSYRIYPNVEQKELIHKHFGCVRYIYNNALATRMEHFRITNEIISKYDLIKRIPKLKKQTETIWLKEVNSQSLQQAILNLDTAYTNFFRKKKGFPKFKSGHNSNQSFQIPPSPTTEIDFENKTLRLPKFKNLKFDAHRKFDGEIHTITISSKSTGKYFISILVENGVVLPPKLPMTESTTIGIDLGITDFLIKDNGEKIANPRYLKNKLKSIKRSQRSLSRRVKGSNNRNKQKLKVARLHERVANLRRDFHHKVSTTLVRDSQTNTIIMENLGIKDMQKNKWLAQSISDVGWGEFVSMVKYKCDWYGKNFLQIGRYEPSSKLCTCGKINRNLKLSDRIWTCPHCNTTHDRDILAANNIKQIGMELPEFTPWESFVGDSVNKETRAHLASG